MKARPVCELYQRAAQLAQEGIHVLSTDEKTGIQALERKYPTQLAHPWVLERQEFEYIRHGTVCLIANFEVATGRILSPTIGLTRTESDFVAHISQTVEQAPEEQWIFIVDQLNTHQSEGLVNFVSDTCGLTEELGEKGKSGILLSKKSRAEFLSNSTHRIRFVYTPKHGSWLNQVEIWFGILVRRLLKRTNAESTDVLASKIQAFIEYFNQTMAKPFKWKYTGPSLQPETKILYFSRQTNQVAA